MHGIDDDEFEVKLGRIGNRRARKATSYLRRVRQAADPWHVEHVAVRIAGGLEVDEDLATRGQAIGVARASYVGVMAPVVALLVSTLLEGFIWHPLTAAGVTVSLVGNVLVLGRRNS